ncbi:MAG: hypothetical protein KAV83_12070 [Desulfobacterales bacterium]|nr:hypothetical protein [Desulfobacterales bacterium]
MGVSLRIFLVLDDDSLDRLPLSRLERLFQRHPDERFPQFANFRVRYALAAVDLVNRKPVEILRIQYAYLSFDSEGKIDAAELQKQMRLGVDMVPPVATEHVSLNVLDAKHRFVQKRYHDTYRWRPTPEIEAAIVEAVFGKH